MLQHEEDQYCRTCGCEILSDEDIGDIRTEETRVHDDPIKKYDDVNHIICMSCVEEEEQELEDWLASDDALIEAMHDESIKIINLKPMLYVPQED